LKSVCELTQYDIFSAFGDNTWHHLAAGI